MNDSAERPNYQQVKAMIKQFTGQANTLVIPRVFIDFTKDHLAAMLLSQILYWSDRTSDPDGWFYKTADEWDEEIGLSNFQVKRATALLKDLGVETRLKRVDGAPRTHYRVDMDTFVNLFFKFLENRETQKSRNSKMDIKETAKSDFQETAKTYKEHRLHAEITCRERECDRHDRPDASLSQPKEKRTEEKPDHPAVIVYQTAWPDLPLNKRQKELIASFVGNDPICIACWNEAVQDYELSANWKPGNVGNIRKRFDRLVQERRDQGNGTGGGSSGRPPPTDNRPPLPPFQPQSRAPTNGAKLTNAVNEVFGRRKNNDDTS